MRLAPSEIPKWPIGLRLCLHWPSGCLWLLLWWLLLLLLRWFLRHRLLRVRKVKEASQKPFCSTATMQKSDEKNATKKLKTFFCICATLLVVVAVVFACCCCCCCLGAAWLLATTLASTSMASNDDYKDTNTHAHICVHTHTCTHTARAR